MCISNIYDLEYYPQYKNPDIIHSGFKIMIKTHHPQNGYVLCFPMFEYEKPYLQYEEWYEANDNYGKYFKDPDEHETDPSYLPAFHIFLEKEDALKYWVFQETVWRVLGGQQAGPFAIVPILFKEMKAYGEELIDISKTNKGTCKVAAVKNIKFINENLFKDCLNDPEGTM